MIPFMLIASQCYELELWARSTELCHQAYHCSAPESPPARTIMPSLTMDWRSEDSSALVCIYINSVWKYATVIKSFQCGIFKNTKQ